MIEQKSEAIDALKGKLEFVKRHQSHDVIHSTMLKVEEILTRYVDLFPEKTDAEEKAAQLDVTKSIAEIDKLINKSVFGKWINSFVHTKISLMSSAFFF